MPKYPDGLTKYGRLTIISSVIKNHITYWICVCDCGADVVTRRSSVLDGKTQSCGCLRTDRLKERASHKLSQVPEYKVLEGMVARCYNPDHDSYKYYGGRGIRVCERWLGENGIVNFYNDMGARPSPKHTIDRKDNDGDYCPENCRWATQEEQSRNRSNNRLITFQGRTQTISEWSRDTGLSVPLIRLRLERGWSIERTLCTLARHYR